MKKNAIVILVIAVGAGLFWFMRKNKTAPQDSFIAVEPTLQIPSNSPDSVPNVPSSYIPYKAQYFNTETGVTSTWINTTISMPNQWTLLAVQYIAGPPPYGDGLTHEFTASGYERNVSEVSS